MRISIISDKGSWINSIIPVFVKKLEELRHTVFLVHGIQDLTKGDLCFILSFSAIMKAEVLSLHEHNLVVHESDLPLGKGWSPLTWQILEGKSSITVTLFEADPVKVDAGVIYLQDRIEFDGSELVADLRNKQADITFSLCLRFVEQYPVLVENGIQQRGKSTYYRRRTPADSELDVTRSIAEQFNILRTVDNEKYPAFFKMHGYKYVLSIRRDGVVDT